MVELLPLATAEVPSGVEVPLLGNNWRQRELFTGLNGRNMAITESIFYSRPSTACHPLKRSCEPRFFKYGGGRVAASLEVRLGVPHLQCRKRPLPRPTVCLPYGRLKISEYTSFFLCGHMENSLGNVCTHTHRGAGARTLTDTRVHTRSPIN